MVETLTPIRSAASTPSLEQYPTRRSLREAERPVVKRKVAPPPAAYVLPSQRKPSLQRRVIGVLTVLLVPGFLVTSSIPAMAFGSGDSTSAGSGANYLDGAQTLAVASDALSADVSRDLFDATTTEDLASQRAAARARLFAASTAASDGDYSNVGPRQAGDDYPWRNSGGLSPLAYVIRQCTDFVAWRLNRDAGSTKAPFKYVWAEMTPGGGSASQWAQAWRNNNWKTSHKPVNGAVAWFTGNHVAYVKAVKGDDVILEEYNWMGDRSYHTRTIPASEVALFLYPPP